MPISVADIQCWIQSALPDALVSSEDLSGDGYHYAVFVESEQFRGMSHIDRLRCISAALSGPLSSQLASVSLQTSVPEDDYATVISEGPVLRAA